MELNGDSIIELNKKFADGLSTINRVYDEFLAVKNSVVDMDMFIESSNQTNKRIGDIEDKLYSELNDNYIKLVQDLFEKTNAILADYNEKYQELFSFHNEKYQQIEKEYLVIAESIENFKILESSYKNIANNLIDERLTTEVLTDKTAERAAMKILNAFNAQLVGFNKEERDTIYKALFDVLLTQNIVTTTIETRKIKPLNENSKFHKSYAQLKNCVLAGIIPMVVGPSGSSKSHAIEQLASDLGLHFYMANRIQNTFELVGFVNAAGNYVTTQFYEAFTKGGLFFFDEVDASSPEALVTINAAIAQGYMAFPGHSTTTNMHENFKVVVAGNTYGTGSTLQYTGRNKLDAATLDRFMILDWDYDNVLEKELVDDNDLLDICWALRKASSKYDDVIVSTRGIITLNRIIKQEEKHKTIELQELFFKKFFSGIQTEKIEKIISKLENESVKGNKYLDVFLNMPL